MIFHYHCRFAMGRGARRYIPPGKYCTFFSTSFSTFFSTFLSADVIPVGFFSPLYFFFSALGNFLNWMLMYSKNPHLTIIPLTYFYCTLYFLSLLDLTSLHIMLFASFASVTGRITNRGLLAESKKEGKKELRIGIHYRWAL